MMSCRGIRGATTVSENDAEAILEATRELLERVISENGVCQQDVASVVFSATADLDAVYPAVAARQLGWTQTPLFCVQEMSVVGSLPRCIRVLVHWNTELPLCEIHHIYLREARVLRPDLAKHSSGDGDGVHKNPVHIACGEDTEEAL